MIKRILYIVNLSLVLLLLLAWLGSFVSPNIYDKLSLLTYAYPILFIINFFYCILWLFVKIRFVIVPLLALLLQINNIPLIANFSKDSTHIFQKENITTFADKQTKNEQSQTTLNFASYNVCGFLYKADQTNSPFDSILALLQRYDIDVVAMQDFPRISPKHRWHKQLVASGYKYFFSHDLSRNIIDKSVIYSKYPIGKTGGLLAWADEPDEFIFADIRKGNKEFRIYNLHLESYLFSEEEKDLSKVKDGDGIIKKLLTANKSRAKEVDALSELISQCQKPFLVVGDFNDTPFSYAYRKLSKQMTDCFVKKGNGFGTTYDQLLIPFRIDYVLTSKDFTTLAYDTPKADHSDHLPVFVVLKL